MKKLITTGSAHQNRQIMCKNGEIEALKCKVLEKHSNFKILEEHVLEPTDKCKCKDDVMDELKVYCANLYMKTRDFKVIARRHSAHSTREI